MAKFRSKPFEMEATQWLKNGDHPLDYSDLDNEATPGHRRANDWEGDVVRRYRHPDISGNAECMNCDRIMHEHGWIDTRQGGHTVCPGDWIITEPDGKGFYPCKPDVFAAKYEPVN